MREGDSLWVLAEQHYRLPVWLLRQFNPDVHPDRVRTGVRLVIPQVSRRQQEDSADGRSQKQEAVEAHDRVGGAAHENQAEPGLRRRRERAAVRVGCTRAICAWRDAP